MFGRAFRKRQRAQHQDRPDRIVRPVLMPAGEGLAVRVLDSEGHAVAKEIGPDQILVDVENMGQARDLLDPGAQEMRLAFQFPRVVRVLGLEGFEMAAIARHLVRREDRHGGEKSLRVKMFDLFLG